MGAGKVLAAIFIIIILVIGVVGFDLYQTGQQIQETDFSSVVSSPTFSVSDDNGTVTASVSVNLPKAGFIPKGVIFKVTVNFEGSPQTVSKSLNFGDSKTITMDFVLSQADKQTITNGGTLTVTAMAKITPTYLGIAITQFTQDVDLGTQTISK